MQQSVTINNTQQVVSIIPLTNTPFVPIVSSPPQSINPQLLFQAHPNDIPSPDTPCNSSPSMVSQSHGSDFPPIFTEEEQTHEDNLPNTEIPCKNPSSQSDHSNICESSSNLPISNETPIQSRGDFRQVSTIISGGGINVTINTQAIQFTISTPQNAHTPCVRSSPHDTSIEPPHPSSDDVPPQSMESNSSPQLHSPTPGLNKLIFRLKILPQWKVLNNLPFPNQPLPPLLNFTFFPINFVLNFIKCSKCLIQDDQLKPNIKQHLKQSTLWVVKNLHKGISTSTNAHLHIPNGLMN
ncbi:hypothetical protein O181_022916 [Austropuccinia psidii MF-1]|uniref:Uncharacterized protein n=1 Tax=Austropuccinia psidii MF-1 TaxID=1389203 RepID=A0A9Q3CIE4_9BASI|nr:hypothetical protein [Austropuccinia psidii MF-1]